MRQYIQCVECSSEDVEELFEGVLQCLTCGEVFEDEEFLEITTLEALRRRTDKEDPEEEW